LTKTSQLSISWTRWIQTWGCLVWKFHTTLFFKDKQYKNLPNETASQLILQPQTSQVNHWHSSSLYDHF
jgi:hypothetical protein